MTIKNTNLLRHQIRAHNIVIFLLCMFFFSCLSSFDETKKTIVFSNSQFNNMDTYQALALIGNPLFFYCGYKINPQTQEEQTYLKIQTLIDATYITDKFTSALIPEAYIEGFIFGDPNREVFCVTPYNDTFKIFDFSQGLHQWEAKFSQYDSVKNEIGEIKWVKFEKKAKLKMRYYEQIPWGEYQEDSLYVLDILNFNTNYDKYSDHVWSDWRLYIDKKKGVVGMILFYKGFSCDEMVVTYAVGKIPSMDMHGNYANAFARYSFYTEF